MEYSELLDAQKNGILEKVIETRHQEINDIHDGKSLLEDALENDQLEIAKILIKSGIEPLDDQVLEKYFNKALDNNRVDLLQVLNQMNLTRPFVYETLKFLFKNNNVEAIKELLQEGEKVVIDIALSRAISENIFELAEIAIKAGPTEQGIYDALANANHYENLSTLLALFEHNNRASLLLYECLLTMIKKSELGFAEKIIIALPKEIEEPMLKLAANQGIIAFARKLLERETSPASISFALFLAAKKGDLQWVNELMTKPTKGVDLALQAAIKNKNIAIQVALLKSSKVGLVEVRKAFLTQIRQNHLENLQKLVESLKKPIDNYYLNSLLQSSLKEAVQKGNWRMVKVLMEMLKDQAPPPLLAPVLLLATENGNLKIVKTIIHAIKKPITERQLKDLYTDAFVKAIEKNNLKIVRELIKAGFKESWIMNLTMLEQSSVVDELKKNALKRAATHYLGLSNEHYEGYPTQTSVKEFKKTLDNYQLNATQYQESFLIMKKAFRAITNAYDNNEDLGEILFNRYQAKELTLMPSGWPGHFILVGAIKINGQHFLFVANRGDGMQGNIGGRIYRLKQPLTKGSMAIFINRESAESIFNEIKNITSQSDLFHAFHHYGHKYGTCGIANNKTMVHLLLHFLQFVSSRKNTKISKPEFKLWMQKEGQIIKIEYKKFSHFLRRATIDELLFELKHSPFHPELMIKTLAEFCNQHADLAKQSEFILLYRIINEMPKNQLTAFIKLLESNVKNTLSSLKQNPFILAIEHGHVELIQELLNDFTANPFVEYQGQSAFDVISKAPQKSQKEITELLDPFLNPTDTNYDKISKNWIDKDYTKLNRMRSFYIYLENQFKKLADASFVYFNEWQKILRDENDSLLVFNALQKEHQIAFNDILSQWKSLDKMKDNFSMSKIENQERFQDEKNKLTKNLNQNIKNSKKEFELNLKIIEKNFKEEKREHKKYQGKESPLKREPLYLPKSYKERPALNLSNKKTEKLNIKFNK